MKRNPEYKPLLFTTTMRNPERIKRFLNILTVFDGKILTNKLAENIMGEMIRFGLYRPMKQLNQVKEKWKDSHQGNFATKILSDTEVFEMLRNNPQNHKEAGFDKGWPSRFATSFDYAKELGFVYYWRNEPIQFSRVGLKLANSIEVKVDDGYITVSDIHSEYEQQAFLHALAKSQRNNPFVRVLNENVPFVLLLEVIKKLNSDNEFNDSGISRLELPLIIFWKDSNADGLYKLIKRIREKYRYNPSWEVIIDICIKRIMGGNFKKFKPKSIMVEYPDEFIRKMRITGLISLRGRGRFIDINKNEQEKVDYVLDNYSVYKKYQTEKDYFKYMATIDERLFSFINKPITREERNKYLEKWINIYSLDEIKKEMLILSKKELSRDDLFKLIPEPVRLEFLTAIAIKSKFRNVKVFPNYPCDDEGIPTSTAGGVGDKGDIECFENINGILIEVTMSEGGSQTKMEIWPITRHLESFGTQFDNSMCYFIAPSIFIDSKRQIDYSNEKNKICIVPKTIQEFLDYVDSNNVLYYKES